MAKKLERAGQIQEGDTLVLSYRGEGQAHTVAEVLNPATDREEILLNIEDNLYFITSMAIDGTSWAEGVLIAN